MITIATHRYNGALHNTTNNNTNNHTNERTHITTPSSLLCEGGGCDHIFLCESICEYVCVFLFSVILSLVFVLFFTFICANILTTLTCSKIRASLFFSRTFFLFYLLFSSVAKKRVLYKNKLLCLKPHPPPFCVLTQSDSDSDCCPLLNLC